MAKKKVQTRGKGNKKNKEKGDDKFPKIGGQAVIEGIMMKSGNSYSVAVRTPSGQVDVTLEEYDSFTPSKILLKIPFIRGIFSFIDSMILGIRTLNYSASFYEEAPKYRADGTRESTKPKFFERLLGDSSEKILSFFTVLISLAFAIMLFMIAPYYLSQLFRMVIVNETVITIIEGILRVAIFIAYVVVISSMKDIKRVYKYHAAEHKCINCLESGRVITVENVRKASRLHKRCGTSFMFFVVFVSIILFMFIREDNPVMRLVMRLLLLPVIAGISYEIISLAGATNFFLFNILSWPGLMLQKLTTCELDGCGKKKSTPDENGRYADDDIIEVAIAAVDAVYDWKKYLIKVHKYEEAELEKYKL